jgi:drug/metabolite transporter (DMT)-like permease
MVAVFIYLQPLIGFILAMLFLGESLSVKFVVSTACIFVGVFLVSRSRKADAIHLSN